MVNQHKISNMLTCGTVCSLGANDGVGIVYGRDIAGKKQHS